MPGHPIFSTDFAKVYPMYFKIAEHEGQTRCIGSNKRDRHLSGISHELLGFSLIVEKSVISESLCHDLPVPSIGC
jgi:hypothetical protein